MKNAKTLKFSKAYENFLKILENLQDFRKNKTFSCSHYQIGISHVIPRVLTRIMIHIISFKN